MSVFLCATNSIATKGYIPNIQFYESSNYEGYERQDLLDLSR